MKAVQEGVDDRGGERARSVPEATDGGTAEE